MGQKGSDPRGFVTTLAFKYSGYQEFFNHYCTSPSDVHKRLLLCAKRGVLGAQYHPLPCPHLQRTRDKPQLLNVLPAAHPAMRTRAPRHPRVWASICQELRRWRELGGKTSLFPAHFLCHQPPLQSMGMSPPQLDSS